MSGGHIRQRSAGSFEICWREGGRLRSATIRSTRKADAQRALREQLARVDRGVLIEPGRITVGEWLDRWLSTIKTEVAAQTHANYETTVRTRIKPALGSIQLARLSPADLQTFYSTIAASGLKPSSAAHVCIVLNVALSRAVELRLLATHPGEAVKKRKPRAAPRRDFEVLDRDQCARMLAAARDTDLYPMVLIALATGMRRGEILALSWDCIDFDTAEIAVNETIVRVGRVTMRKPPKNGKPRVVSISRCLIPGFDGALFSPAWREALWARFFMAAPRRQRRSVERYNIVKRA